jgi:uncharacterized protein (TIGR02466 family)|tara:strand:+ start:2085 stop:2720 length:636 start_codon:yes stop_codon:yes gene_type:complete
MIKKEFFKTPIWVENKKEYLTSLTKATNKYIKEAKQTKQSKEYIKHYGDFGNSYPSTSLTLENDFIDFRKYIGMKSSEFLDFQGFDVSSYALVLNELWVQEFSKKGGGHHSAHIHYNQHVSGFYFLKCSENTSFPVFYDPRTGARATKLKLKIGPNIDYADEKMHYRPTPGDLVIFPGYLEHEFVVDHGIDPFRLIHFNIQAVPKEIVKND